MEGIIPMLTEADIYLFEDIDAAINNGANYIGNFLNELSFHPAYNLESLLDNGTIGGVPIRKTALGPIVESVYGSGKICRALDLHDDISSRRIRKELSNLNNLPEADTFGETIDLFADFVAARARLQEERDEITTDNFEKEIEKIFVEHPLLKEKRSLKIVIQRGVYHTRLRHKFLASGIETRRVFADPTYSYQDQLQRSYAFNKIPSRDLLQRAYIECLLQELISDAINDINFPNDMLCRYVRKLVCGLTEDHLTQIYLQYKADSLTVGSVDELMSSSGTVKVARSAEQIKDILVNDKNSTRALGTHTLKLAS